MEFSSEWINLPESHKYSMLEIDDYSTSASLQAVISKCVSLRPEYWYQQLKGMDLIIVIFEKKVDQIKILQELVKQINKGIAINDSVLNNLPIMTENFDQFITYRRKSGYKDDVNVDHNKVAAQKKSEGLVPVWIYTSSPLDHEEDNCRFSFFSLSKECCINYSFLDDMKINHPKIYDDMKKYYTPQTNMEDNDLILKIWKSMTSKNCYKCGCQDVCKKCSKCGCTYYCNSECQKLDWTNHKDICSNLRLLKIKISSDAIIVKGGSH